MPPPTPASANPAEPVLEVDFDRDITALYSSITSEDWDAALDAVGSTPAEARTWVVRYEDARKTTVQWRFLPLHSACARQPPGDLVKALLKAHPDGAACEDDQGMWPLHYACGNQASSDVIGLLLKSYPEAAKMPDPNGMLPLHYLAKWGPSEAKIVDMLLSSYPDAVSAVALEEVEGEENRNITPLDLAEEGEYEDEERDYVIDALNRQANEPAPATQPVKKAADEESASEKGNSDEDTVTDETPVPVAAAPPAPAPAPSPVPAPAPAPAVVAPTTPTRVRSLRSKSPAADLGNKTTIAKLVAQLESTRKELSAAKRELGTLRDEKATHDAYVELCEEKILKKAAECEETVAAKIAECEEIVAAKDREVEEANAERDAALAERDATAEASRVEAERLEAELEEMTARHEVLMEKADDLNGHVIALTSSVASLREDHDAVQEGLNDREERARGAAQRRQRKLRELIDYEVEMAKLAEEEESDGAIQAALDRQKEEMEAVAAILEAVNAKEELLSLEGSAAEM